MKFDRYCDPGHAWCKVPRSMLTELGIAKQISPYSYQREAWVYLEEDSDLTLFARTLRATGATVEFRDRYAERSSKIRGYEGYRP